MSVWGSEEEKRKFAIGVLLGAEYNGIVTTKTTKLNKIEGITKFTPTLCATFFQREMIYDSVTEVVLTSDMTRNAGRDGEWAASFLVSIFSTVYYSYDTYEYNVFYYLDKRYHEHIFKMESNSKYCLRLLQWYETLVMKSMLQVIEYSRKGGIEYKKSSSELYTFVTDKDSLETTYTLPSPITYENEYCRYVAGYPNSLSFKYDGRWYTLQSPWCNEDIALDSSPVSGISSGYAIEIDGYIHTVGLTVQKTYRVSNRKTGKYRLVVALTDKIGVIIE